MAPTRSQEHSSVSSNQCASCKSRRKVCEVESFEFFVFAVSKFVKFNFADFAFCDFLIRRMRPVVCYRDDTRRRVRNCRAVKSACHSPYKYDYVSRTSVAPRLIISDERAPGVRPFTGTEYASSPAPLKRMAMNGRCDNWNSSSEPRKSDRPKGTKSKPVVLSKIDRQQRGGDSYASTPTS